MVRCLAAALRSTAARAVRERAAPQRRGLAAGAWAPGQLEAQFEVDFVAAGQLGSGAVGTVFPAQLRETSQEVAIKTVSAVAPTAEEHRMLVKAIKFETEVFARVLQSEETHPHVMNLVGCFRGPGAEAVDMGLRLPPLAAGAPLNYFVMERMDALTLQDRIDRSAGLSEEEARETTRAICSGLQFLHSAGIVHRDIKPANVMFQQGVPKLIDFSASGVVPSGAPLLLTDVIGSPGYVAPEVLSQREPYGAKADVFSLGCTLRAMLTNTSAASLPETLSPECRELILELLSENPEDRPEVSAVLQHPWLSE